MSTQNFTRSWPKGRPGPPAGQQHPKAVLSDREVDEMRNMYEEGGWGYDRLAAQFGVSKSSVRDIILCRKRAG